MFKHALAALQCKANKEFKEATALLLDPQCVTGVFTLTFYLLDHLCDDLKRFGITGVVDAFPLEHSSMVIEWAYRKWSLQRTRRTMQATSLMWPTAKIIQRNMRTTGSAGAQMQYEC